MTTTSGDAANGQQPALPLVLRGQRAVTFTGLSIDILKDASRAGDLPCVRVGYGPKGKAMWAWRAADLTAWIDGLVTVMTPADHTNAGRPARSLPRRSRPARRTNVLSAREALRQSAA